MSVPLIVPVLPHTAYKEQLEKDFERSLEYVHVQRKIIKAIGKHDIALTARTAYIWTSESVPKGQWPEPLQALRLCYYMRSLGYDTFASIDSSQVPGDANKTTSLCLLVANPDSEKRGVTHDHLYWAQDIGTGEVVPIAYKLRRQDAQDGAATGRPLLTLDTGSSFDADGITQQFDQRGEGLVQMRGGEDEEHYRFDLTMGELERPRAAERMFLERRAELVADEAVVARVERLPDARPNAEAVEEASRNFQYSPYGNVSPGEIMSATNT